MWLACRFIGRLTGRLGPESKIKTRETTRSGGKERVPAKDLNAQGFTIADSLKPLIHGRRGGVIDIWRAAIFENIVLIDGSPFHTEAYFPGSVNSAGVKVCRRETEDLTGLDNWTESVAFIHDVCGLW